MPNTTEEIQSCYHCGDDCREQDILAQEKHFCCLGCKTVYELLAENNMCDYYALSEERKPNKEDIRSGQEYAYLKEADIRASVVDYEDEKIGRVELAVPSIHCSSCIWVLEKLNEFDSGVVSAQVNFSRKTVYVVYRVQEASLWEVCSLMARLGYPPVINLDRGSDKAISQAKKRLLIKIGITGFCAGNIMLLSFPEYFQMEGITDGITDKFFRYLNMVLSLPVVFIGAQDYLVSAWRSLRSKRLNIDVPLSLGILALFGRSMFELLWLDQSGYLDSLAGLVFFLLLGKWFQQQIYAHLDFERDFSSFLPMAATKLTEAKEQDVLISTLKKGDELLVRSGSLLPTDAIMLNEESRADMSFITGEAEPIKLQKGAYLYAGARIVGQSVRAIVQKPVDQSYLSRLWESNQSKAENKSEINAFANTISKYFVFATLFIALAAGLYWYFTEPAKMWFVITAILIVACPCALALSSPFTFSTGMAALGKKGFYLKQPDVLRDLAEADTALFDKTGTLSESGSLSVNYRGEKLTENEKAWLALLAAQSAHPASKSLAAHLVGFRLPGLGLSLFQEHPGQGVEGLVEGSQILLGKASFVGKNQRAKPQSPEVHVLIGGRYKGCFHLKRKYREGIREMGQGLKAGGMALAVVSGDHSGEQEQLEAILPEGTAYYFEQQPHQKKAMVGTLQGQGKKVMMTGDGINDAAALGQANVGLAITESLTAFSPASDGILLGKSLPKLAAFQSYARSLLKGVRIAFVISLLYNLVGISFAVTGHLSPIVSAILMPVSSISVVLFGVAWATFHAKYLPSTS